MKLCAISKILIMRHYEPQAESRYDDNFRMITFSIISITIIFTLLFIIQTYYEEKNKIIRDLHSETDHIENIFLADLDYTATLMEYLATKIAAEHDNIKAINDIISDYRINLNILNVCGWVYFAWIDKDLYMTVNDVEGILKPPCDRSNSVHANIAKLRPSTMLYAPEYYSKTINNHVLPTIYGVEKNGKFLGAILTAFDTKRISSRLNAATKNN